MNIIYVRNESGKQTQIYVNVSTYNPYPTYTPGHTSKTQILTIGIYHCTQPIYTT